MVHALATNNYGPSKFIVTSSAANGTHTTIAAALADAVSGDTIFLRNGTYTENITLKAGVNLYAYSCDAFTPNVTIVGKCTLTDSGTVSISGINLQTNSDFLIVVSGSNNCQLNLESCYLSCSNNTGISFTNSNSLSQINIFNGGGSLGAAGITFWSMSATGTLQIQYALFLNRVSSVTYSNNSAGIVNLYYSQFEHLVSATGTGFVAVVECNMNNIQNLPALSLSGTSICNSYLSFFQGGTSPAISIEVGSSLVIADSVISSSNTNAISGAGTLTYQGLNFFSSSQNISVTTTTGGTLKGSTQQAPSVGFIGEQISSSATSVATTTTVSKTITSISLTAGIWDISAISYALPTGGTALMGQHTLGISTTTDTLSGNLGDDQFQITALAALSSASASVPQKRAVLTATTIYYAVVNNVYGSVSCPTNARITATRVG